MRFHGEVFMPASENTNNFWNLTGETGQPQLFPSGFLQGRRCPVIGRMRMPVLLHRETGKDRKHHEANDPFFLSGENEHQVRRRLT
jgi:hypothetical protein